MRDPLFTEMIVSYASGNFLHFGGLEEYASGEVQINWQKVEVQYTTVE